MSNPSLCALISKWLGTEAWIRDIDLLIGLQEFAADADLHQEWKMVLFSFDMHPIALETVILFLTVWSCIILIFYF